MSDIEVDDDDLKNIVKLFVALCRKRPFDHDATSTIKTLSSRLKPETHRLDEVLEWYEDIKLKVTFNHKAADSLENVKHDPRMCKMSVNIMSLLRQCVLTHRWSESVQLLQPLSEEIYTTLSPVWKVSMEVMLKSPDQYQDIVEKMVRRLSHCAYDLDRHEIVLDYLLYLLSHGQYKNIQDLPGVKENIRSTITERISEVKNLYSAYAGLMWYGEWLRLKDEYDRQKDGSPDTDINTLSSSFIGNQTSNLRSKMDNLAHRISELWIGLVDKTGVWDIFLYKLIEVYEEQGKLEEAEDILKKYKEKNDMNISIYKQMYYFYVRHQYPQVDIINSLKGLVKLDPSSSKVLDLSEYLIVQDPPEIDYLTSILFCMMDYSIWQNDVKTWTYFTNHILQVFINYPDNVKFLRKQWKNRDDIWPDFHFHIKSVDPRWTSQNLLEQKALCCALFNNIDNEYTTAAKQYLQPDYWLKIQNTLDKCLNT
ncbi:TATA box-binding protein-associated factor RNA polymerase I subunit A [Patella vulgata]|uniref:TATA box-binding protein-associated factor RNA polymerase I subunit A n=1 Tax=Patella vulgata TaxID=6465 RepID=UPI00217FC9A4|nr:TATA box-binding protein-associated factor RNA polymerase I subunit A [Patella vulgata]